MNYETWHQERLSIYRNNGIDFVHQLCKWIIQNDRYPNKRAFDQDERHMGNKLLSLRRAKRGDNLNLWCPIYELIASEYNLDSLFDKTDYETISLNGIVNICEFTIKCNRPPKMTRDPYERKLCKQLHEIIIGARIWRDSYQHTANKYGLYDLFKKEPLKERQLQSIHDICKFIKTKHKYPSNDITNKYEYYLHRKIASLKSAKQGYGKTIWNDEYERIAYDYGFTDLFLIETPEQIAKTKATQICEFYRINNALPTKMSDYTLYQAITGIKLAKKGLGTCTWYPIYQQVADEYGFPFIFDSITRKRNR